MTLDCLNVTDLEPSKFNVTTECAAFDFAFYTVVMGSLCVLGLVGNAVSFTILWRDQSKGATPFLLRALAVADSLLLLAAIPTYVLSHVYPYTETLKSCYDLYVSLLPRVLWPIYQIPYTATIMLTVLVSLNRYLAVCRPFKSNNMCAPAKARHHVVYVAVFAVVYNIPRFFEYESRWECTGYNVSQQVFEFSEFGKNPYYGIIYNNVLYFAVLHGGPLLMLSFLNFNLIKTLKQRQKKRMEMGKGGYQQDITLVLVVIVFVFIFCQTPTFIDRILWTALDDSKRSCGNWHYYYTAISDTLVLLNSSVNFVIYILTSRKFRQALLTACPGGHDPSHPETTAGTRAEMTALTHAPAGNGFQDKATEFPETRP